MMDEYLIADIVELCNTYVPKKEREEFASEFISLFDIDDIPKDVIDHIRTIPEFDKAFANMEEELDEEDIDWD